MDGQLCDGGTAESSVCVNTVLFGAIIRTSCHRNSRLPADLIMRQKLGGKKLKINDANTFPGWFFIILNKTGE